MDEVKRLLKYMKNHPRRRHYRGAIQEERLFRIKKKSLTLFQQTLKEHQTILLVGVTNLVYVMMCLGQILASPKFTID